MRRALFFCALLLFSPAAAALEVPPPPDRWFTDRAGLVSPTQGDLLNRKLQEFEQSTGAQFIIYVLPSLEGEALEDFTIRAVERWKVGQKKYDNGLVLFVFARDQKTRIEVGYGLEGTITDAFASRVLRDILAPRLRQRDYAGGLHAAADAIMTKIRTGEEPVPPLQQRGSERPPSSAPGFIASDIILTLAVLFFVFFFLLPMFSRRRRGGCGGCVFPFFFFPGGGITFGGGGFSSGGFGGGGFGGGGFSGGGGGFGGGGASGGW